MSRRKSNSKDICTVNVHTDNLHSSETKLAIILFLPACLVVMAVLIFPLLYNLWMSLHDVQLANIGEKARFVFFNNYVEVLHESDFLPSLKTSLLYTSTSGVLTIFWGMILALLLNRKFAGAPLVRSLILIPFIIPVISSTFVWRQILDLTGIFNNCLKGMGLISEPIAWSSQKPYAFFMVVLFHIWRYSPLAMVMILARLQTIPKELYDAAHIDGAGPLKSFRFVTLPQLRNLLVLILALRFIWTFNNFDDIYLLTSGAAGTMVLPVLTYEYSFGQNRIGLGAANAIVLMLILMVFLTCYFIILRTRNGED